MKRHAFLAIGLLASILGLTVLVDTTFADGCCCCCDCCGGGGVCGESPTPATKACASGPQVPQCIGEVNQVGCEQNGGPQRFEVADFPKACTTTPGSNTVCNEPNANCSRPTACVWKNNACGTDPTANNAWNNQQPKPTPGPCP